MTEIGLIKGQVEGPFNLRLTQRGDDGWAQDFLNNHLRRKS